MHLLPQKVYESKSFFTYENDSRIYKSVSSHPFNRSVTITHCTSLPWTPRPIKTYHRGRIILSQLLGGDTFSALCKGTFNAFSTTRVDSQDHISIHRGILRLSLTKDTYQRAGLQGEASHLSLHKYNVTIDCTSPEFSTSKQYARLKLSFEAVFQEPIEVLVSTEEAACQIAGLEPLACKVTRFMERRSTPDCTRLLRVPDKTANDGLEYRSFEELQEDVQTHIALLSVPSTVPHSSDPYISTYVCPAPSESQEITSTTMKGFISSEYIRDTMTELSTLAGKQGTWFTIQIRGYEYTSMSWIDTEHGYLTGGENDIIILSMPATGAHERKKEDDIIAPKKDEDGKHQRMVMWEIVGSRDAYN